MCVCVCGDRLLTLLYSSARGPQEPHRRRGWKAGAGAWAGPDCSAPPSAFYSSSFGHARVCDRILPESSEKTGNSSPSATNQSTTKQALLWEGPGPSGGVASVEEDGVGVPVGDLSHVLQDVLLGDDPQQPPVHAGREKTHLIGWRCFQAQ